MCRIPGGLLLGLAAMTVALAAPLTVTSPDGSLAVSFSVDDGRPRYGVTRFGRDLIRPSALGFVIHGAPPLDRDFRVTAENRRTIDETWVQPWGEQAEIRCHCRELRIELTGGEPAARRLTLVFRVFDDGVGFRYEIPAQPGLDSLVIMDELTEFALAGDHRAWWIPAYQPERYEYLYRATSLSEMDRVHTPLTMETADGVCLCIHEAALTDYAGMTLARRAGHTLKADLVPWSDGVRVRATAPLVTPWRTLQVADTPGGLADSRLILNLNEPCRLDDVSWITPAKYVGVWWEMHLGTATWGSGPRHGATTANAKRYIDFAAGHGFGGVLVEGWNVGWDGEWIRNGDLFSFTRPYDDFDLEEVCRYAAENGVRLIGHHETAAGIANYEAQLEEAFALYERLGVRTVKTGYVGYGQQIRRVDEAGRVHHEWHHGQFMVRHYRKVVEAAARHHIMLDVHEPIKDTGIRRTWPNMMTREGARGQEYNAWGGDGGNPPDHTTILPFTRLLAGPMDFTPGIFDLHFPEARPGNRVNTTLAKQLALYVVLYSPLQMAADLPENYRARPDALRFIQDVPVDWRHSRVLHARIGDYVTCVRQDRHSEDWYLGSITDDQGRILDVPLVFLAPGRTYVAEIYRDGRACDWRTNPYDMEILERLVDGSTTLDLRLAPGGGQAIRFRPAKEEDIRRLKDE